jgi:hypothetical protein
MKLLLNRIAIGIAILVSASTKAQVVLNEIYSEPGAGKQEFFELYNINTSNTPSSLDAYTVISYFEDGNEKGFYVLDLPNLFVPSKGYFVGASGVPFNYQGTMNSTAANFNWNDPDLPLNYGYLRKWVANGNSNIDGNKNYDLEVLPSDFNDFFSRRSGSGATYNAFVYKNGTLVNSFFGGTGGNATMPNFITSMPMFKLEVVTASTTQTHVLNFGALKNKPIESIEYVTQDIGSDNGYIKTRDGFCGTWTKSSSTAFHTPSVTNGVSGTAPVSELTLDVIIQTGATTSDPALVTYNITAGSTSAFPVELQLYVDNGSIPEQLDSQDQFIELNEEKNVSDGPFTASIPGMQNVLVVAKTDAGCIDQIAFAKNLLSEFIILPIQLVRIQGSIQNNDAVIEWTVAENESGNYFEIEKSYDGKNFTSAGIIGSTNKTGNESYRFTEPAGSQSYYRVKVVGKNRSLSYSKILAVKAKDGLPVNKISLLQNPVSSVLSFNYQSVTDNTSMLTIYNMNGVPVHTSKLTIHKGLNTISLNVNNKIAAGTYLLELTNTERSVVRFIKTY